MQNAKEKNSTSKTDSKKASKEAGSETPKLTSKVDRDGNYVFDQQQVNEVLLWAIEKSQQQ